MFFPTCNEMHTLKQIFSLFIVIASLVSWASANITPENIDTKAVSKETAQFLQDIDMLCRGQISLPANIQKELKCRYIDHGSNYLKIAPLKEEDAYLKPRIVIFHDVISNEEIRILKRLAQPEIKLDEVKALQSGRIAQVSWIKENHKIVDVLNRRIQHMTRLSVANAEAVQVCYYRIGGMFLQHVDFFPPHDEESIKYGNRIATVMFYLHDVKEGGKTVFPILNVSLTPEKGSAVFWYNLNPNGIGDLLTEHARCPVIAGTKWVANVWLSEIGQEFIRPCTLENQPEAKW